MSQTAKFLFENDFSGPASGKPRVRPKKPQFTDDDLAAAKAEGIAEGRQEGQLAALAGLEANMSATMEAIGAELGNLDASMNSLLHRFQGQAAELAVATARSLARHLIAAQPEDQVIPLIESCLQERAMETRLVVRVSPAVIENIQERLDTLAAGSLFEGRLITVEEPAYAPGDCTIEWAEGGVEQKVADIEAAIDALVQRYVGNLNDAGSQQNSESPGPDSPGTVLPEPGASPPNGGANAGQDATTDQGSIADQGGHHG